MIDSDLKTETKDRVEAQMKFRVVEEGRLDVGEASARHPLEANAF